jgi:4-hydroxybenzoate polyprenyltransferase
VSPAVLFRLARPKGTVVLLVVPLLGWGLAHWDRALAPQNLAGLALVLVAWTIAGWGTMWLNAALDGEEGGALFSDASLPSTDSKKHQTRVLNAAGMTTLVIAIVLSFVASIPSGIACCVCAVLSVLYSHPRTRWKEHPWLGPIVNASGYGMMSCLAGWFLVSSSVSLRAMLAFGLLTTFVVGITFGAQAFQRADDARRGYRTLVVTHGPEVCLRVTHACVRITALGTTALIAIGFYPRACLLGVFAFWFAESWMRRWRSRPEGGSPSDAAGLLFRMMGAGVLLIALAYVDYLRQRAAGLDVAGLGTALGRPD